MTEEQAYAYARQYLPERISTESKENGDRSGLLEVYKFEGEWFVRYLDAHIEHSLGLSTAIVNMAMWLVKNRL